MVGRELVVFVFNHLMHCSPVAYTVDDGLFCFRLQIDIVYYNFAKLMFFMQINKLLGCFLFRIRHY